MGEVVELEIPPTRVPRPGPGRGQRRRLGRPGFSPARVDDLRLAVSELCANAIEAQQRPGRSEPLIDPLRPRRRTGSPSRSRTTAAASTPTRSAPCRRPPTPPARPRAGPRHPPGAGPGRRRRVPGEGRGHHRPRRALPLPVPISAPQRGDETASGLGVGMGRDAGSCMIVARSCLVILVRAGSYRAGGGRSAAS